MLLRQLAIALTALAVSSSAFADFIGARFGAGMWDHDPSGTIRYDGGSVGTNADLKNDLNLEDDKEGYFYALVEHPVPLIPNVKIMQTNLTSNGSGTITTDFTYGGQSFSASQPITSELVLDHTDVTLYWQLLDNVVSFDFGITGKMVDAEATLTSGGNTVNNSFDGIVPMGYLGVGVTPWPGLEFRVEGSALEIGDSSLTDYTAKVSYTTSYLLGVEAGYRSLELELDDLDDVYSNMEFDGPFLGVYLDF
ncbi:MAG: TIGR04219 family outer membrane beta-barrel protein [Thiohalophilus sp.]|uniref:TIGR04219 family outer membrane beta-barrel protein n=1 Tax=Thiohalophilus sp. TaxID=3028392 RepID=UPI00286FD08B|nr:TIGR04219 family outer membrane beta-barrel protein [Thiohalophilus sp.]MDR9437172.1 TIGR04219 family outer membrane beta-barrel protein [Thiohalophilus sp.]